MSKKHHALVTSDTESTSHKRRTRKLGRSKNALTHGAYASDIVLPGENRAAFLHLLEGVREQFCPLSALEDAAVFELTGLQWKKQRVDRFMQVQLMNTEFARKLEAGGKNSAGGIHRMLHRECVEPESEKEDRQLAKLMKALSQRRKSADPKDHKDFDSLIALVADWQQFRKESAQRMAEFNSDAGTPLKLMEKAAKIQDLLDSNIDRKIKRIVMLKEYDRMYGQSRPKSIENLRDVAATRDQTEALIRSRATDNASNDNDDDAMREWKKKAKK
jgi:hypothetical protein